MVQDIPGMVQGTIIASVFDVRFLHSNLLPLTECPHVHRPMLTPPVPHSTSLSAHFCPGRVPHHLRVAMQRLDGVLGWLLPRRIKERIRRAMQEGLDHVFGRVWSEIPVVLRCSASTVSGPLVCMLKSSWRMGPATILASLPVTVQVNLTERALIFKDRTYDVYGSPEPNSPSRDRPVSQAVPALLTEIDVRQQRRQSAFEAKDNTMRMADAWAEQVAPWREQLGPVLERESSPRRGERDAFGEQGRHLETFAGRHPGRRARGHAGAGEDGAGSAGQQAADFDYGVRTPSPTARRSMFGPPTTLYLPSTPSGSSPEESSRQASEEARGPPPYGAPPPHVMQRLFLQNFGDHPAATDFEVWRQAEDALLRGLRVPHLVRREFERSLGAGSVECAQCQPCTALHFSLLEVVCFICIHF